MSSGHCREANATPGRPTPSRLEVTIALACAFALGTVYVSSLIGWERILPTSTSWLTADASSHYLGWAFVRQDPALGFPVMITDRVGFPEVLTAAYFDPIPLLVYALLPISWALPAEFQFLGLFQCAAAALTIYFGYRIARLFTDSWLAGAGAGALLASNSALTLRFGSHAALTGQFFLVAALYLVLSAPTDLRGRAGLRRRLTVLLVFVFCALGVNPYIGAMTALIALAGVFQEGWRDRKTIPELTVAAVIGFGVLAVGAWSFGYWGSGQDAATEWHGLYRTTADTYSNPRSFSLFLPGAPPARVELLEGTAYLGVVGLAAFGGSCVALGFSRSHRTFVSSHAALLVIAGLAFCVALADGHVVPGQTSTASPLRVVALFRASGRFSWILMYVTYALGVATLLRLAPRRLHGPALGLAAIIQLVELSPLRSAVAEFVRNPAEPAHVLRDAPWDSLGQTHAHLVVLPAWQCGARASPGGNAGHATFGLLAARQGMTINSYYASRYDDGSLELHCHVLPDRLRQIGAASDTAYVVDAAWRSWFDRQASSTHRCVDADGYSLCVALDSSTGS